MDYNNFKPAGGYNNNGGRFGSTTASGGTNYNNTGNNSGQPYRKKSGCKTGMMSDGKRRWVSGWHGIGTEFVSFIANPGKNNGKTSLDRWVSMIANFKNNRGQEWTVNCLWDTEKKRLKFTSLGWVANPSAPNGGYVGKGGVSKTIPQNNNRR